MKSNTIPSMVIGQAPMYMVIGEPSCGKSKMGSGNVCRGEPGNTYVVGGRHDSSHVLGVLENDLTMVGSLGGACDGMLREDDDIGAVRIGFHESNEVGKRSEDRGVTGERLTLGHA
jgi:hypothetical protein